MDIEVTVSPCLLSACVYSACRMSSEYFGAHPEDACSSINFTKAGAKLHSIISEIY
jgi:hypothetical protein